MFRHVVMMTFADDTTDDELVGFADALSQLPASIPEIRNYSVGLDAGLRDGNADLVVVGDFVDRDGFKAYMEHPEHRRVGSTFMKRTTEVVRVQYEL